ncbi:MAG TPA: hypothetical protein VH186_00755 [Chloroflexia bacterium]|nr:hypothetical protein [Chloroflexia bacterium]
MNNNQPSQCVDPQVVYETDYLAFLHKDGRSAFVQHLAICEYCRDEVEAYRKWDTVMRKNFEYIIPPSRTLCTDSQQLGDYFMAIQNGHHLGAALRRIEAHLSVCQECRNEAENLRTWLEEPTNLSREEPGSPYAPGGLNRLRRVVASLLSPARIENPLAATASVSLRDDDAMSAPSPVAQIYSLDDLQIAIIAQAGGLHSSDFKVRGLLQSLSLDFESLAGSPVRLYQEERILASSELDDTGSFSFRAVPPVETFDLEIVLNDRLVVLPGIKAGQAA